MFEMEDTALPGVHVISLPRYEDARGTFSKVIHIPSFRLQKLRTDFVEQFLTVSRKNVLRGMHFQMPPHDHAKLVTCASGRILDVVVDLRPGDSFGKHLSIELGGGVNRAVYLPSGCAHGFLALTDDAVTLYNVTSVHAPPSDAGVHWRSIGFDWPVSDPVTSSRDEQLPPLGAFASPFAAHESNLVDPSRTAHDGI